MSIRRWSAGGLGRLLRGKSLGRSGQTLLGQEAVGQHDQTHVAMETVPETALVVVQAALALGIFVELLDAPAAVGQLHQAPQRRLDGQVGEVPLGLPLLAGSGRSASSQPSGPVRTLRPCPPSSLPVPSGRARRRTACADGPCALPPDHGSPGRLAEASAELGRRMQGERAGRRGRATGGLRRPGQRGRLLDLGRQTHREVALDSADVGELTCFQPGQEIGVVTVAGVGHPSLLCGW